MLKSKLNPMELQNVRIEDSFWNKYIDRVFDTVIPYQWKLMNDQIVDAEPSGCIRNFRIAAGLEKGEFTGMPFQDSDLAKWMEAAAFSLATNPDKNLMKTMDEMIDLLEMVQESDGYLDTYFILNEPGKKWLNLLEGHELYVAGHFIEAAVAYFHVTGNTRFLNIVCKNADLICKLFGEKEGQIKGYPGHQEIELALLKLYEVTGNKKYKEQARFFLMERGKEPYILDAMHKEYGKYIFKEFESFDREYCQTHLPIMEQTTAEGHAVRAVYMYTAMADLAYYDGNKELLHVCERLYQNLVEKRMYITGGIGSAGTGERFTCDYDLPNGTAYAESCASIGLMMFCQRMLCVTGESKYADTMETALYNTVLAGIGLDGKHFFYVNPLEVVPQICENNTDYKHVKAERQTWFACACCPPNIARTLASIQSYAAYCDENSMYFALYLSGLWKFSFSDGELKWIVETKYPFEEEICFKVSSSSLTEKHTVALRIPGWCHNARLFINGVEKTNDVEKMNGFYQVEKEWENGDEIRLVLEMKPYFVQANPQVHADAGRTALMKGPMVYCIEETDNGKNLSSITVNPKDSIVEEYDRELFGGCMVLKVSGHRDTEKGWGNSLYRPWSGQKYPVEIKAIPYCFWNNREKGEMCVWIRVENGIE